MTLEDRWILSNLNRTIKDLNDYFSQYAFDRAAHRAYEFFWNDFCAQYVELSKPVLSGKTGSPHLRENKQKLLASILSIAIRLMHPIAPFITEEIFSLLKSSYAGLKKAKKIDPYTRDLINALNSDACIVAPFPVVIDESHISTEVESTIQELFALISAIRNIRSEMQLPPSEKTHLYLLGEAQNAEWLAARQHQDLLLALTPTAAIHFVKNESEMPTVGSFAIVGQLKLALPIPDSLKAKEKGRLEKEKEKLQKQQNVTKMRLSNDEFKAKAPPDIVRNLEESLSLTEQQLDAIVKKLQLYQT